MPFFCLARGVKKKIYAVPPYTDVKSRLLRIIRFRQEDMSGRKCRLCGAENVYFDEMFDSQTGERFYQCSDTGYCLKRREAQESKEGDKAHG